MRRNVKQASCLAASTLALLALLSFSRPAHAQPEYYFDHLHLSVVNGASPYTAVTYGISWRDGTVVVLQTKSYPYSTIRHCRTRVVDEQQALELLTELVQAGIMELPDAQEDFPPFALTWLVEVGYQGQAHSFAAAGPEFLPDPLYARIIDAVTAFVNTHTGVLAFRDLVHNEARIGLLNMRTVPPAEVSIDGIPVGVRTPFYSLELSPGPHHAYITSLELGIERNITFTIQEGEVTNINLTLDLPAAEESPEP